MPMFWRGQQGGGIGIHRALLHQESKKIAQRGYVAGDGSAAHAGLVERIDVAVQNGRVVEVVGGL